MKRFLPVIGLLAILSSCEIPFDLDQEGVPRIYVQCVADNGQVSISPYLANPVSGQAQEGASLRVSLQVNGAAVALQKSDGPRYSADCSFLEGDELSLRVEADGQEPVTGVTRVPRRPVITDYSWQRIQVDTIDATEICLTLDSVPGEGDYFGIQILRCDKLLYMSGERDTLLTYVTPGYILTAAESGSFDLEDFMQLNYDGRFLGGPTLRPMTLLTSKQFEGPVYRFYLNSFDTSILSGIRDNMPDGETGMAGGGIVSGEVGPGGGVQPIDPNKIPVSLETAYTFTFYSLSAAFYFYAKALFQSNFDFLANMGLIPANFCWTNLSGGMGFVGAVSSTSWGPVEFQQEN